MKTVFVGGGQGCQAVLELAEQHRLATLSLEILGVVDINDAAPAMEYARRKDWPTYTNLEQALGLPELELVIELTGIDQVRDEIYQRAPAHVRVMDHNMARVFWDLDEATQNLRQELEQTTRLESEIREDRRRLQKLLDSLPDVVMVVEEDGAIESVNRRFTELTGQSVKQVIGKPCCEAVCRKTPEAACEDRNCPRHAALSSSRPVKMVQMESCFGCTKEDGECYYEIIATPITRTTGETHVVITSREVTEQILLKRETEVTARRYDQIMAMVYGIITIKDLKGRYQEANASACRFYGLRAEAFIGRTARELFPPEFAEAVERHDAELIKLRRHLNHEERMVLGDKEHVLVSERILLNDYQGQPNSICCVSRDDTHARQLQRDLLQSEKHAAVGKLAAGVAHEINNPLTGILSFAEDLLEDAPEGSPQQEDLEVIMRETLRCRQIVRDLLDFSRQTKPKRQPVGIEPIIQRTLSLVQNQAAFHDINFEFSLDRHNLLITVDPNQIQQVLLNLVINARDAMDGKGTIVLRSKDLEEKGAVQLEVIDHGCGIPEENLPQVFEPFFSTKGNQGNGLGLATVRSIIEDHEGKISVESAPDKGSVFRIRLPAVHGSEGAENSGSHQEES